MSIVRIGLAETKDFADGYDAIFGTKKPAGGKAKPKTKPKTTKPKTTAKKKTPAKKKTTK